MKKYTIKILVATVFELFLVMSGGTGANLSRAYGDSNFMPNLAKMLANTSLELKGEKLTSNPQAAFLQLNLTTGYVRPSSLFQVEVNQQSFSDPQNPGHAPGHPRPSALTPLFFGVSGVCS